MGLSVNESNLLELIGKVLVVTALMLLFVVIFLFLVHTCNKPSMNAATVTAAAATSRYEDLNPDISIFRRGIDPSVVKSIQMVFAKDLKEKLECAICICDISGDEKARILPKCNHGFHVDCIDMWFQSNSTCPVCRNPVSDLSNFRSSGLETTSIDPEANENRREEEALNSHLQLQVRSLDVEISQQSVPSTASSSSAYTSNGYDGLVMIDIPHRINEAEGMAEEESDPPVHPMLLNSYKRLLNYKSVSSS